MFLDNKDSARAQGDIGEARAIYEFTKMGYLISIPTSTHCPYDLIIDDGQKLQRVQVKTSQYEREFSATKSYEVCLATSAMTQENRNRKFAKTERTQEYDLLFVLTGDGKVWIIPEDKIEGKFTISLNQNGKYARYLTETSSAW